MDKHEEFGYLSTDPRGYVGPNNRRTIAYWAHLRDEWEHVYTLNVFDLGNPDSIVQAKRSFFGVPR
jgi:hypothetical protein